MKLDWEINDLAKKCHQVAIDHGLDSTVTRENQAIFSEKMLLVVSEVSEALEEFRNHHTLNEIYYEGTKPCGIPIELADIIIRILDFCVANKITIRTALRLKVAYNETREYRHGNKKA